MEKTNQTTRKDEVVKDFAIINTFSPLGSLTLLGSLIAIHVYDYLKTRESKEAEA